jgi:AcrR family transcriptional regulator
MSKIEDIHRAALKIINEEGLSGAPVAKIAAEAGVAAGTMYVYYKSKDELLLNLYRSVIDGLNQALSDVMEEGLAEKQQFYRLWLAAFKYFLKKTDGFLFMKQFAASPQSKLSGEEDALKGYSHLEDVIERAQGKGLLKKMPVSIAVSMVSGIIATTVDIQLSGSLELDGSLLQELLDSSWRMMEKV